MFEFMDYVASIRLPPVTLLDMPPDTPFADPGIVLVADAAGDIHDVVTSDDCLCERCNDKFLLSDYADHPEMEPSDIVCPFCILASIIKASH